MRCGVDHEFGHSEVGAPIRPSNRSVQEAGGCMELAAISIEMAAKDVRITRGWEDEQGDRNVAGQ